VRFPVHREAGIVISPDHDPGSVALRHPFQRPENLSFAADAQIAEKPHRVLRANQRIEIVRQRRVMLFGVDETPQSDYETMSEMQIRCHP
jgi:hypothetical protein